MIFLGFVIRFMISVLCWCNIHHWYRAEIEYERCNCGLVRFVDGTYGISERWYIKPRRYSLK